MKKKLFVFSVLVVFIGVTWAWGETITKEIYYQKKTSLAYPATYTFKFSLWDTGDVGTGVSVWEEEKQVKITSALIKTYLGDSTPLDPADFSEQLWVQVEKKKKDGSYVVIGIRDKLRASPYGMMGNLSGSVSVSAIAGIPRDSTIETAQSTVDGYVGRYQSSAGSDYLVVPINLPDGATITSFSYTCYDNHANDSSAHLYNGLSSVAGQMAVVNTSGASTSLQTVTETAITNPVVDNSIYNYWVYMEISGTAGNSLMPIRAVVTYEY